MRISEIFFSLQGEGSLTGVPSVFIRTSGCNLRCSWCDTPYASWQPEGRDWDVASIVQDALAYPARHCVLTGGEPMAAKEIHDLARALKVEGFHITIETAATIAPGGIECDLASLSPKLSNSTPSDAMAGPGWALRHEKTRLAPEVIADWIRGRDYQIKFVVSEPDDLREVGDLIGRIPVEIPPHKVHLMPEGTAAEALEERQAWLVDACKAHGYRFSDRLHIRLFGNTRGT